MQFDKIYIGGREIAKVYLGASLVYNNEVEPIQPRPFTQWTLGSGVQRDGNSLIMTGGANATARGALSAKAGTPFILQWQVYPTAHESGVELNLHSGNSTASIAYIGGWITDEQNMELWYEDSNGEDMTALNYPSSSQPMCRLISDGNKVYGEYSINGGATWQRVLNSIPASAQGYQFSVSFPEWAVVGTRINNIMQEGLNE